MTDRPKPLYSVMTYIITMKCIAVMHCITGDECYD